MLEFLYNKIFVNIVVSRSRITIYIETLSKHGVVDSVEESFETTFLNDKVEKFIAKNIVESPYYYVSILDTSLVQGALSSCDTQSSYIDRDKNLLKCIDNSWSCYTSKEELKLLQKSYSAIGLDFIFSPFIILSQFFKDKIHASMSLYILVEESHISLMIFNNSELVFSKYLDLEHNRDAHAILSYEDDNIDLEEDDNIDLEEIDAIEDVDLFEDFGDIEDLDSIDDIDEFADSRDLEEELLEDLEEASPKHQEDGFNEDYQRFALIQGAINHYYKDDSYESEFIENIYIADGIGVSQDLKHYLEEEMFLSVYIRKIDLVSSLSELARRELNL
jgi:hypothetical protein